MEGKRKRPVEFAIPGNRIKFKEPKTLTGIFHQFGNELKMTRDGYVPVLIALCEDENGNPHKVDPEQIKFLDR